MGSAHLPEIFTIDKRSKCVSGIFKVGDTAYAYSVPFSLTNFYFLRRIAGSWFPIKSIIDFDAVMVFHG